MRIAARTLFWTGTLTLCLSTFVSAQDSEPSGFEPLQQTITSHVSTITPEALNSLPTSPPAPELVSAGKAVVEAAAQIYALPDLTEANRRWTLPREAVALIVLAYAEPSVYYSRLTLMSDELEKRGLSPNLVQMTERNVLEIGTKLATRTGEQAMNLNREPQWEALAQRMVIYADQYRDRDSLRLIENFLQHIRTMNAIPRDRRLAIVAPIFHAYYTNIHHTDTARSLEPDILRATLPGQPMPLMGVDTDGNDFLPASVRGKIVLLHFWGTWCIHCKAQIPDLIALYEKYHTDGLEIIGINTGTRGDDERKVRHFLETERFGGKPIPWINLHEGLGERKHQTSLTKRYGISELPVMILLGRDGKVLRLHPLSAGLDGLIAEATSPFADDLTEEERKLLNEALQRQQEEIERELRALPEQ